MSSSGRKLIPALALAFVAAFATGCAAENYPQSIFDPVTDLAVRVNDLFAGVFWWTMLVLAVVWIGLVFILIRYRDRPGAQPRKIYGSNIAEILWTLGPALIVISILVPTVRTIFYTYERPENPLLVEAVGHQWWWEFRYPELGITTANQLYLPAGKPIEVRLSSSDVVHNWWVPAFGGKRYNHPVTPVVDGAPTKKDYNVLYFTVDRPGEYPGQCAEFCGTSHALMRMLVVVQEPDEFEEWVERQRAPQVGLPAEFRTAEGEAPVGMAEVLARPAEELSLEAQGYQVFVRAGCAACHTIDGTSAVGVLGPNLTNVGARWTIGAGVMSNTRENMLSWVRNAPEHKPDVKMTPFTHLSDSELDALAAYLVSLK